ncbi:MAG: helix-turn-helix transcriptional regulator [Bacteroidales bacterium]|nr:helix-turn-helix transcriptional regulator [Bacteroidales bacterium]
MKDKLYFEEHGEQLLKRKGISKAEFARRLGIHKQNVNSVFSTKSVIVLRKVAQVLDVPFELLISYSEEPDYTGCVFYSDMVIKAKYIRVVLPYFRGDELFTIEGDEGELPVEDLNFRIPLYDEENKQFDFTISLDDAKIYGWSYDANFRLRAKVCDSGTYILLDGEKKPLLQIEGYVPDGVIPPLEHNWGDYVDFYMDSNGKIANWPDSPDLMIFAERGTLTKPIGTNKWQRAKEMLFKIKNAKLTKEELEWIKTNIMC